MTLCGHFGEKGPRLQIYFKKTAKELPLDHALMLLIRRAIKATLAYEGVQSDAEVSFSCCKNEEICLLNREYRQKDAATDVLSFPLYESREEIDAERGVLTLGDIVVSYERAAEQAESFGHSAEREVVFLTIHSVLHLLGYDHERSQEEDEIMCQKQKNILDILYGNGTLRKED